jgi:hypothetical protein
VLSWSSSSSSTSSSTSGIIINNIVSLRGPSIFAAYPLESETSQQLQELFFADGRT